jgi:hypothetical protein
LGLLALVVVVFIVKRATIPRARVEAFELDVGGPEGAETVALEHVQQVWGPDARLADWHLHEPPSRGNGAWHLTGEVLVPE